MIGTLVGCTMRVVGQTLTEYSPALFPYTEISGVLEFSGLLVWSDHIVAIMTGWVKQNETGSISLLFNETISGHHKVGNVLQLFPHLLDDFVSYGLTPLNNPVLRRTLAKKN